MPTKLGRSTNSALIAFEPRQVTLAKQNMAKKLSAETLANNSTDKTLNIDQKQEKSKKKKKSMNSSDRALLFHSIAAYLDRNGFSETLSAFRSETLSKIDDWMGHSLDLEEMFYKYLESSKYHMEANVNCSKQREIADLRKDGATEKVEGESNFDVSVELTKKKKKKNNEDGANSLNEQPVVGNCLAKCVDYLDKKLVDEVSTHIHVKSKEKKKKHKLEVSEEPASDTSHEPQSDVLNKSKKDKKKKKSKLIPGSHFEDIENGENVASSVAKLDADDTYCVVSLDEKHVKSKDKKKKRNRLASESPCFEDKKEFNQGDPKKTGFTEEDLQTKDDNGVDIKNKSSKKRKRLVSEESKSQSDGGTGIREAQLSKDEGPEEDKGSQQHPKEAKSIGVDENATKKRKTHNGHIDSNNSREMSVDNQLGGLVSRDCEKDGIERSASEKMIKKQHNGSAEPKTVNAFQRVKVEQVKFVDERLQDNSYWAKDGAETGYGAKAQEVLGQVRGRDFRHEKTKKKRGSYRGGQIDLHSHSIKFNYSDEE
ncbi:lisH domain-containing protein C1711.05 [Telopea speciosissima]|uniref:lisH domain-containing protein C1711.05 n=1 Tax=Telopea speciosissima TaxID=54955 RepID=UPI001CC39A92|nr:lisH domain-containing protein C1711.05 [Telopea speciosissima]